MNFTTEIQGEEVSTTNFKGYFFATYVMILMGLCHNL
jgi:hypothetical protein